MENTFFLLCDRGMKNISTESLKVINEMNSQVKSDL